MSSHRFGGKWTQLKLEVVGKYLDAYLSIMHKNEKAKFFKTAYVDAFAGTGYVEQKRPERSAPASDSLPGMGSQYASDSEKTEFLEGSARVALSRDWPFDRYIFIEKNATRAAELELLKNEFPERADRIEIHSTDANSFLQSWCEALAPNRKRWRAVVFLDPYGMQVNWETVVALGQTEAVDLIYLFPHGIGVGRHLPRRGQPDESSSRELSRLFGTDDWKDAFYLPSPQGRMFADLPETERDATSEKMGRFLLTRLKAVFPWVARKPYVLLNSKNVPLYLLCLAAANKDEGGKLAVKIFESLATPKSPYVQRFPTMP